MFPNFLLPSRVTEEMWWNLATISPFGLQRMQGGNPRKYGKQKLVCRHKLLERMGYRIGDGYIYYSLAVPDSISEYGATSPRTWVFNFQLSPAPLPAIWKILILEAMYLHNFLFSLARNESSITSCPLEYCRRNSESSVTCPSPETKDLAYSSINRVVDVTDSCRLVMRQPCAALLARRTLSFLDLYIIAQYTHMALTTKFNSPIHNPSLPFLCPYREFEADAQYSQLAKFRSPH
ncbi:uncharacterized protein BDR25DRAFT_353395 [Lindgomyces ingoldianus]|uniref:Uncharacterized protein n=1 Tax=Lindgomyces ingoldianus TaxID=673940 RepID=A0ACB6QZ91_9PLEO|nr:uncharacterized protein BDR25DRAFT_353395 [Lindgomyces ingoldianus]KAF2472359.1 hypothetical protein BDR25DRAFT_353395 [Lindgomyces ingoldianus]